MILIIDYNTGNSDLYTDIIEASKQLNISRNTLTKKLSKSNTLRIDTLIITNNITIHKSKRYGKS
jgi:predicted DNA-binding protein (UPF0251 family)